ncbi:MBL fold metallo-hydrolase [Pirellulaceae bacterium SH467]
MTFTRQSIEFPGEMILLGTGTSVGVPAIGCGCSVCLSKDPRNNRTRSSAIVGLPGGNLLIDTAPDLRQQLLREGIGIVHSVLYTHEHADHLHGMDDIRLFPFMIGGPVPVYASKQVQDRIVRVFDYAFHKREPTHAGAAPQLDLVTIDDEPFDVLGARIQPIPLIHGPYCNVYGFRIGNVAYCTDTNRIEPSSMELLRDLDTLVLDALRFTPHPTHFSIEEALHVIELLRPKNTYLTHLSHEVEYERVSAQLPEHVHLSYDGLRIPLT